MSSPDFSKVWSSGSSLTPYEFSDADYIKGWEVVGGTPPARTMFDALQRNNDLKTKDLNTRTTSIEDLMAAQVSKRSHAYALGDTTLLENIPAGYFLECTTAGTTGATTPVITSPTVGGTVNDGTVVWTIRKSASTQDLTHYINNEDGIWQTLQNVLFRNSNLYSMIIQCGTVNDAGGRLLLGGKNNGTYKGGFYLTSQNDDDGEKTLEGHANGTLTWGGNDLAGSVIIAKSLTANGYVKRASGELLQWGSESVIAGTSKIINYNLAFTTGNYKTFITPVLGGATYASAKIAYEGGRYQFSVQSSEDCTINWFAIGW